MSRRYNSASPGPYDTGSSFRYDTDGTNASPTYCGPHWKSEEGSASYDYDSYLSGRTTLTSHTPSVGRSRWDGPTTDPYDARYLTRHEDSTFSSSFPPRSHDSSTKYRDISGFPSSRFGSLTEYGSAPSSTPSRADPFREAKSATGAPYSSPYGKDYRDYKDHESGPMTSASADYKSFMKTAYAPGRREREEWGGSYAGMPLGTSEWHLEAGHYAGAKASAFDKAADLREKMTYDYIGYGDQKSTGSHLKESTRRRETASAARIAEQDHYDSSRLAALPRDGYYRDYY